jgi:hypothetical protein
MLPRCRATRILVLLLVLVLAQAAPARAQKPGQPVPPPQSAAAAATGLAGSWTGFWMAPEGYFYTAAMRLEMAVDNSVQGQITWTLQQSPRKDEESKVGLTGIEYVRGTFDPSSGVLVIEGYEEDDPNTVIGLDRYRLVLAENGIVLGGITWHYGDWKGLIQVTAER